jgi:hypothetical protein
MIKPEDYIKTFKRNSATESEEWWKILAWGYSKVGKTYFIGSLPNPFILNTDDSLRGLPRGCDPPVLSLSAAQVLADDSSNRLKVFKTTIMLLEKLIANPEVELDGKPYRVKTFCVDSLSTLSDLFLMEAMLDPKVRNDQKDIGVRLPGRDNATWAEWRALKDRFTTFFSMIKSLDMNVYYTCEVHDKKSDSGTILNSLPDVGGSTRESVGHNVDIMMYLYNKDGKYYANMTTKDRHIAGTRGYSGPDVIEQPSFDKIFGKENFK